MTRKLIAQIIETASAYVPTKCALHLKPSGTASTVFVVGAEAVVIDATNFLDAVQGDTQVRLGDSIIGFTGSGYIISGETGASAAYVTYPIQFELERVFNVFLRLRSTGTYQITVNLDGVPIFELATTGSGDWEWVLGSFVAFDSVSHTLSISFNDGEVAVDKIVISTSDTLPVDEGPDYTDSPYITAHVRLATLDIDELPDTYFNVLSYHTSADAITKGGWYNFLLTDTADNEIVTVDSKLAIVLSVTGSSRSHFLIWDTSEDYSQPIATKSGDDAWISVSSSMAIRVYSSHAALDEYCGLVTPEAKIIVEDITDFSDEALSPQHDNTVESSGSVSLDMDEKLLSVVVDQSGSMTWNDATRTRFDVLGGVIDTLDCRYPSNVRFNLFEYHGEPAFSVMIPLKRRITSNTIAEIVKTYFENDSDYFAGIRVVRKKGSYPTTFIDGEIVSDGFMVAALDIDLEQDTTYYYTVFTYDQSLRPSRGVQIKAVTHEKVIPRGLPNIKTRVLLGHDVVSDDNSIALWNMDEQEGTYVYNFGTESTYLTLDDTSWLDYFSGPTGVSGLRFNGFSSKAYTESTLTFEVDNASEQASFFFWIYPFENSANQTVFLRGDASDLNYVCVIDNGTLKFGFNASSLEVCDTPIPIDEWTHVGIVYDNGLTTFYIHDQDGTLVGTNATDLSAFAATTLGSMPVYVGYDPAVSRFERFFGKISHFSIHAIAKDASFAADIATPAKGYDEDGNPEPVDNGDRVVVFDYVIPDDFDYQTYRIVRNAIHMPSHEEDGEIVIEDTATAGIYTFGSTYQYDLAHTYYFRVFTQNSLGNWCHIEDARKLEVYIPDQSRPEVIVDAITGSSVSFTEGPGHLASVPVLSNIAMRNGNDKVYFTWDVPADPATRVVIYYAQDKAPYYDEELKSIEGGVIIFDGTLDIDEFVHRKVGNNKPGFYILVPKDRYGHFNKNFVPYESYPRDDYDDSGIPLLEVTNVSWHLEDYDRIKITWDSPVGTPSDSDGWFDDKFYVYLAICDLYGNPIPFAFPEQMSVTTSLNVETEQVEDVFNLGIPTDGTLQLPVASFSVNPDGIVVGTVRLRPSNLLTNITKITISLGAIYQYSPTFSYTFSFGLGATNGNITTTTTGGVTFNNPLELRLVNRDGLYLQTKDFSPPDGCDTTDEEGGQGKSNSANRKKVNGVYIRRKLPFAIRAIYSYKGQAITSASVSTRIFDASGGPCGITPTLTSQSQKVLLASNVLSTQLATLPLLGPGGQPTGATQLTSYTDILLKSPNLPQSASTYVMVRAYGYQKMKKMHAFFPSTLRLTLTAAAPLANDLDVREQFARAFFVDPDNPNDLSRITNVPDLTIAKWSLTKGGNATTLAPFYSTDAVPLANGVHSYFRSGIGRNIFFGPAGVKAAGTYLLTVSTTARGLFSEAKAELTIESRSGGSTGFPPIPSRNVPRIFCEFPDCVNYIWADGKDYKKLRIYRNPTLEIVGSKYWQDFYDCSMESGNGGVMALPPNIQVSVEATGYEIVSGDVSETTTGGKPRLNDENATINIDNAVISLGIAPYTDVYFRINSQIEDRGCRSANIDSCACDDAPQDICYQPYDIGASTDVILRAKTTINFKSTTIYGGGGSTFDGRPPTILVPIEPLYLGFIGVYATVGASTIPVGKFIFDGVEDTTGNISGTTNWIYFELRYAGYAIPDGTMVNVKLVADREEIEGIAIMEALGIPDKVFVETMSTLPDGSPLTETISVVAVPVGPVKPNTSVKFFVYVECNYTED